MHGPAQSPVYAIKQERRASPLPQGGLQGARDCGAPYPPIADTVYARLRVPLSLPQHSSQSESNLSLRVGIVGDAYHILGPICRANTDHADVFVDERPVSAAALQRALSLICALPARLAALPARLAVWPQRGTHGTGNRLLGNSKWLRVLGIGLTSYSICRYGI